ARQPDRAHVQPAILGAGGPGTCTGRGGGAAAPLRVWGGRTLRACGRDSDLLRWSPGRPSGDASTPSCRDLRTSLITPRQAWRVREGGSAPDGRVRDRGELEDQRGRQEDKAQRDLVEVAKLSPARREDEHHERGDHGDEGEYVH